jgi:hypothetical protein
MDRETASDRFVAIATTEPKVDLSTLRWDFNVQDIVDGRDTRDGDAKDASPPEGFWPSITVPVTMGKVPQPQ